MLGEDGQTVEKSSMCTYFNRTTTICMDDVLHSAIILPQIQEKKIDLEIRTILFTFSVLA